MKVNNVKPPRPNSAKKNLKVKRDKQREDFEKQQQEANLEIDRLLMQNEDEFSMKVEIYNHQQRFKQKDERPPELPQEFNDLGLEG